MYDLSSPEFITWQSWATAEVGQLIRTAESTAPHTPDQATLDFQPKGQVAQGDRTQLFTILEKIYTDHGPLILQLGGQDENQRIWINLTKALPPGSEEDSSTTGTAEHVTDHKEELVCVLWISPRGTLQSPLRVARRCGSPGWDEDAFPTLKGATGDRRGEKVE